MKKMIAILLSVVSILTGLCALCRNIEQQTNTQNEAAFRSLMKRGLKRRFFLFLNSEPQTKEVTKMSVFRVEKTRGYTVMSNHHLRNHTLSLKAKGLLSQMLSLPDDWDYTLQGLAQINKESIDAIREAVRELERAGYIKRSRERDKRGCLRGTVYTIYEQPHAEPTLEKPMLDLPTLENPTQLNTKRTKKRSINYRFDSFPFRFSGNSRAEANGNERIV